jgi:hypothetical protein
MKLKNGVFTFLCLVIFLYKSFAQNSEEYLNISSYCKQDTLIQSIKYFYIKNGDSVKNINSLEHQYYLRLLIKGLNKYNYIQSTDTLINKPSVIIDFNYYVSGPKTITSTSYEPTYSEPTEVNVNIQQESKKTTSPNKGFEFAVYEPIKEKSLYRKPSGYVPIETTQVLYLSTLLIRCKNYITNEDVWVSEVSTIDKNGDLRAKLPFLIYGASMYFETNISLPKTIKIKSKKKDFKLFIE